MRRKAKYIYQLAEWPGFHWKEREVSGLLTRVRHKQGRLLGRMENIGFNLQEEANLQILTSDVVKSSDT